MKRYQDISAMADIMKLSPEQRNELSDFFLENQDNLIGKIMQSVEILGLDTKQENAFKQTLKEIVYDKWQWFEKATWYMTDKENFCSVCQQREVGSSCQECPIIEHLLQ